MKKIFAIGFLCFICAAGWEIGGRLSTDALGLALGVLFGVMAGIPAALIALSASRQGSQQTAEAYQGAMNHYKQLDERDLRSFQQPIIIIAGGNQLPQHQSNKGYIEGKTTPVVETSRIQKQLAVRSEPILNLNEVSSNWLEKAYPVSE